MPTCRPCSCKAHTRGCSARPTCRTFTMPMTGSRSSTESGSSRTDEHGAELDELTLFVWWEQSQDMTHRSIGAGLGLVPRCLQGADVGMGWAPAELFGRRGHAQQHGFPW